MTSLLSSRSARDVFPHQPPTRFRSGTSYERLPGSAETSLRASACVQTKRLSLFPSRRHLALPLVRGCFVLQ